MGREREETREREVKEKETKRKGEGIARGWREKGRKGRGM